MILWTRVADPAAGKLYVEVAEDERFTKIVSNAAAPVSADADWTTRVLVGGLKPAHVYWFRFMTKDGSGSRIGRTITAPDPGDPRPVRFAFVSCQNANQGAQNAYRRMIYEDERAPENEQLGFVLHLGDFIYELVWYPEDRKTYYDRRIRAIVRYADGEKNRRLHIPTTLADYRAVYKAYLHDPDSQDARVRWPFVPMWRNHEFSWQGFQGMQRFSGKNAAGADEEGFREPGVLRVSAGENGASVKQVAGDVRSPNREGHSSHEIRRARTGRRAGTI